MCIYGFSNCDVLEVKLGGIMKGELIVVDYVFILCTMLEYILLITLINCVRSMLK